MDVENIVNINGAQIPGTNGKEGYQVNYITGSDLKERIDALKSVYERNDWVEIVMCKIDYIQRAAVLVWRPKNGKM